jgi:hypothetical protein
VLDRILAKTPHIPTNAIWMVMDHVRTGWWASVLPKPVRIMVSEDRQLEAIPLPPLGRPNSVGIAIPKREPASRSAEAFFELAKSHEVSARFEAVLGWEKGGIRGAPTVAARKRRIDESDSRDPDKRLYGKIKNAYL